MKLQGFNLKLDIKPKMILPTLDVNVFIII